MPHSTRQKRRRYMRSWRARNPERVRAYREQQRTSGCDPERTRYQPRTRRQRIDSFLTPDQVRAAWLLYERGGLSLREIADRLWQVAGFSSRESCTTSLLRAFRKRGGWVLRPRHAKRWAPRRCKAERVPPNAGQPCRRYAKVGSDYCPNHERAAT